jgi:hypothetical protein
VEVFVAVFPTLIAPNAASLRLQSLCAMPTEREIESAIQLAFTFCNAINSTKANSRFVYKTLCETSVLIPLFRLLGSFALL